MVRGEEKWPPFGWIKIGLDSYGDPDGPTIFLFAVKVHRDVRMKFRFRAQTYQLFAPGPEVQWFWCLGEFLRVPFPEPHTRDLRVGRRSDVNPGINTVRSDTLLEERGFELLVRF